MPNTDKDRFLNPISNFRGDFSPENLAFDANLQEFANRVSLVCALETGGKISPNEAYQKIRACWEQLADSKKNLLGDDK